MPNSTMLARAHRWPSGSPGATPDSNGPARIKSREINVIGARAEVTGSAYLVETSQARVLVDCGLFQGGKKADALNRAPTEPN
ncbi:MAG: hypothetical protein U1F83_03205 [Verrucomicrobiota bacterium]